jgi:uncharacterized protein VirK/YbjX
MLNLLSGRFSQLDNLDEFKNRFKFAFRSALTLPSTLRWLNTFAENDELLEYLRKLPRMASKLHRPYLYQALGTQGKLKMLQDHYQIECSRFPARQLAALLATQSLTLAEIFAKDDHRYRFTLTHRHTFQKEGELSLRMWDGDNIPLVTLTFSLFHGEAGPTLIIGGMQGPRRRHDGPEAMKLATKACHGLFPKRIAMEALTVLARMLGIQKVRAVSKEVHIYSSWRYRKAFESDYDGFWLSLGGILDDQGIFDLPLHLPRKAFEAIASKKRAEYHRRFQLLDDLSAQVASSLL